MSVPTFPCPSGETCFAPECCAHGQCMHMAEQSEEWEQFHDGEPDEPVVTEVKRG